jgi:hypothetical protein
LQKGYAIKASSYVRICNFELKGVGKLPRITKVNKKKSIRVRPRWTKEEVSLLKRLYRTHSNAEIAGILRRKVSSVVFKGHRLGLSKGARRLKDMGRENIRRRWEPLKHRSDRKGRAAQTRSKR